MYTLGHTSFSMHDTMQTCLKSCNGARNHAVFSPRFMAVLKARLSLPLNQVSDLLRALPHRNDGVHDASDDAAMFNVSSQHHYIAFAAEGTPPSIEVSGSTTVDVCEITSGAFMDTGVFEILSPIPHY